jgi:hypothetical protein
MGYVQRTAHCAGLICSALYVVLLLFMCCAVFAQASVSNRYSNKSSPDTQIIWRSLAALDISDVTNLNMPAGEQTATNVSHSCMLLDCAASSDS